MHVEQYGAVFQGFAGLGVVPELFSHADRGRRGEAEGDAMAGRAGDGAEAGGEVGRGVEAGGSREGFARLAGRADADRREDANLLAEMAVGDEVPVALDLRQVVGGRLDGGSARAGPSGG